MRRHITHTILMTLMLSTTFAACAARHGTESMQAAPAPRRVMPPGATAPLFNDLGNHHYAITTLPSSRQRYFDQGMMLAFGFNHAEAVRSFRAAQRLDPACAMCFWGEALATGPNINVTPRARRSMSPAACAAFAAGARRSPAARAPKRARADRRAREALRADAAEDRDALDQRLRRRAWASVVARYPDDDIAAMFAEAWMNTMPWNYWSRRTTAAAGDRGGRSRRSRRSSRAARAIPARCTSTSTPMEASADPARAEAAADALLGAGAGLRPPRAHAGAHLLARRALQRCGRKPTSAAAKVDEAYIAQCNAQGFYPAMYYPHNIHFLWAAASMAGRSEVAIEAARKVGGQRAAGADRRSSRSVEEFFHTIPLLRAGAVRTLGRDPRRAAAARDLALLERHLALRARRRARDKGLADDATPDLTALRKEAESPAMRALLMVSVNTTAQQLLRIATRVLDAEMAAARGRWTQAIASYRAAVKLQDGLTYSEPPQWYFPVRDGLGRVLLRAGRLREAETVYRRQLQLTPKNGWTLHGLAASLRRRARTRPPPRSSATSRRHGRGPTSRSTRR